MTNQLRPPAWGAIFTRVEEHEDNLALYVNTARQLDPPERRKYNKRLKRLEIELGLRPAPLIGAPEIIHTGALDAFHHRQILKEEFDRLLAMARMADDADAKRSARRRLRQIQRQAALLAKQIEPARATINEYRRVQARLLEHAEAIRVEGELAAARQQMKREISHFGRKLVETWTRLGYRNEYHVKNKRRIERIKLERAWASEDVIYYKIAISKLTIFGSTVAVLPDKVRAADLVSLKSCLELEAATERPVFSPHNGPEQHGENQPFDNGVYIAVCRLDHPGGLPKHQHLSEVLKLYPNDRRQRGEIILPVGVRRGRMQNWAVIGNSSPHFMVNGLTGSGKTTVFKSWLATCIQMHSPDEVRFLVTDLKRGGDFRELAKAPHVLRDVITTPQELRNELGRVIQLLRQRQELIGRVAKDINDYNRKVNKPGDRLPRLVLLIDEYSETRSLGDPKEVKEDIDAVVDAVARLGRSCGIHLWIGNQQPYGHSMPNTVKGNITYHLTGFQMTPGASMSTVGDNSATKLDKIPGRMRVNSGVEIYDVQMPDCTDEDIRHALQAAAYWRTPAPFDWSDLPPDDEPSAESVAINEAVERVNCPVFGIPEMVDYALNHMAGSLAARTMFEQLQSEIEINIRDLETLRNQLVEQGSIEHYGVEYAVVQNGRGWRLEKRSELIHANGHSVE